MEEGWFEGKAGGRRIRALVVIGVIGAMMAAASYHAWHDEGRMTVRAAVAEREAARRGQAP